MDYALLILKQAEAWKHGHATDSPTGQRGRDGLITRVIGGMVGRTVDHGRTLN